MQVKERQRIQIAKDTEAFLEAGGVIKIIPPISIGQAIAEIKDGQEKVAYNYKKRTFSEKVNN